MQRILMIWHRCTRALLEAVYPAYVLILILLAFLSFYFSESTDSRAAAHLLEDFAIACAVAVLLIFTFEGVSHRRQQKLVDKFAKQVAHESWVAIHGGEIPKEVHSYITDKFIDNHLYQEGLEVSFILQDID